MCFVQNDFLQDKSLWSNLDLSVSLKDKMVIAHGTTRTRFKPTTCL